ncbi:hypothetical protein RA280_07675 [Cupriavidus sp. CV2]|uniref:hypothetical protein n=1 Tax=Cupriavidus ulmosensis TaxID=3065913 RepID=UPI00296AE2DA|nr:hypothetical protein [Cupriavidus sp. CV2]MDW3681628.1 hypothetical protein [Cupriavidus sp. CV2]
MDIEPNFTATPSQHASGCRHASEPAPAIIAEFHPAVNTLIRLTYIFDEIGRNSGDNDIQQLVAVGRRAAAGAADDAKEYGKTSDAIDQDDAITCIVRGLRAAGAILDSIIALADYSAKTLALDGHKLAFDELARLANIPSHGVPDRSALAAETLAPTGKGNPHGAAATIPTDQESNKASPQGAAVTPRQESNLAAGQATAQKKRDGGRWTDDELLQLLADSNLPGMNHLKLAKERGVTRQLISRKIRDAKIRLQKKEAASPFDVAKTGVRRVTAGRGKYGNS